MESSFSTLLPEASAKQWLELDIYDNQEALISPQQLKRDLAFWIEGYCNRERRHSTIGSISPIDYGQRFIIDPTLTPVNP